MPQSLHQAYAHIIFSTKERRPWIQPELETRLYEYQGGICNHLGASPIQINGMPDHVHLLIRTSKSIADTDFMQHLKGDSSHWLHQQGQQIFAWQSGYAWFSVAAKDLAIAQEYIIKQKSHHQTITFKDELRRFLEQYKVHHDERYLWG